MKVHDLKAPLAVLHVAEKQFVDGAYLASACRRCGAAQCRPFPAQAMRRNGRGLRPLTRCSRRSSP
jgi:hypothetical protein